MVPTPCRWTSRLAKPHRRLQIPRGWCRTTPAACRSSGRRRADSRRDSLDEFTRGSPPSTRPPDTCPAMDARRSCTRSARGQLRRPFRVAVRLSIASAHEHSCVDSPPGSPGTRPVESITRKLHHGAEPPLGLRAASPVDRTIAPVLPHLRVDIALLQGDVGGHKRDLHPSSSPKARARRSPQPRTTRRAHWLNWRASMVIELGAATAGPGVNEAACLARPSTGAQGDELQVVDQFHPSSATRARRRALSRVRGRLRHNRLGR